MEAQKSVTKGMDGSIWGATVKIGTNDGQKVLLNQPIQLVYPLEIQSQEPVTETADKPGDVPDTGTLTPDDEPVGCPAEMTTSGELEALSVSQQREPGWHVCWNSGTTEVYSEWACGLIQYYCSCIYLVILLPVLTISG